MAFAWADTFVPPNAVTGMSSGDHTAIDEWPFADDDCYIQLGSLGTGTVTFTFDMSAGPGDKKSFWVWFGSWCANTAGFDITEIRLKDGTTTLWTDSTPGITILEGITFNSSRIRAIQIPDSAWDTDPAINNLILEFDVANLLSGNNRLRFSGMRMMKTPFTAAQEVDPPSTVSGNDYAYYSADGLDLLGAVNDEAVVLIPDLSGAGRHLARQSGTDAVYKTADGGYIDFPGVGSRFITGWGTRVTGNHLWHMRLYPQDQAAIQAIWSYAADFNVVTTPTDPNDKNLLGVNADDTWGLMSGIGDAASHKNSAGTVTYDAWVRATQWVQDAGNEHQWLNDDASPIIDDASGSNNLFSVSMGMREDNTRPFKGRISEFWVLDGAGFTEANIDDARDVWVNGAASPVSVNLTPATTSASAQTTTPILVGLSTQLTPATLTVSAQTIDAAFAGLITNLTSSVVGSSAQALAVTPAPTSIDLTVVSLVSSAQTLSPIIADDSDPLNLVAIVVGANVELTWDPSF